MPELKTNHPLANLTRFRTGGMAEFFFAPASAKELRAFLRTNAIRPITIIGLGSNILIRDGGIPGLVIHTGAMSKTIEIKDGFIDANAGTELSRIANFSMENGIGGFEFMAGIPGTAAGGLMTNAGCFGGQISDVLHSVTGLSLDGQQIELSATKCQLGYRTSNISRDIIITGLRFKATKHKTSADIKKQIEEIIKKKTESQPTDTRTAGSTFKNPSDGVPAWRKIKNAFPDGLSVGGARISEKHANFIIADDDCRSADIETLIEKIQAATGLELEIKIIGER
ncbi:MAG: UDP-N-acetylmuramate dehydrogenase [Rickettsiales bacterium]|jgi:UDP-N-acetylmuramate dehydrogenase|nr:UDP-N-acetylmuramate dehydrogenase [Rickettsiales bacterium]